MINLPEELKVWSLESLCELEKQTKLLINLPEKLKSLEKYEELKSGRSRCLCELEKQTKLLINLPEE